MGYDVCTVICYLGCRQLCPQGLTIEYNLRYCVSLYCEVEALN